MISAVGKAFEDIGVEFRAALHCSAAQAVTMGEILAMRILRVCELLSAGLYLTSGIPLIAAVRACVKVDRGWEGRLFGSSVLNLQSGF
jgi:hypothetical protein